MKNKYTISNLTEEQLNVIMVALDTYARLGILQFENVVPLEIQWNNKFSYTENHDLINQYFAIIRNLIVGNNSNYIDMPKNQQWSMGIGGKDVPKQSNISYEMYCDLRDFISLKNNGQSKGKLNLTENENIVIEDMDVRLEKMIKILNKINKQS